MILVAWPSATFCMASMALSFRTDSLGDFSFSISKESAEAIRAVQQALADSLEMLNEKSPNESVLKLKAIEAMQKVADGQATKIIIPSELQGIVGLANGLVESAK